ncbi:cytochrome b5 [Terfezia boudieri ATCC MYA-4762]|uniref:Cytochrome b5 n=1 Tax=Terfezia boudieri ATCC MYA-4762 TaxID=1051890 RepID=A0A3N4LHY4_9PEZI|nr:cytochrome b5 [Terfezia boudieri ATCC MYA-4762]
MPHSPPLPPVPEAIPIVTPLNLILFSLVIYVGYLRFRTPATPIISRPTPIVYRKYTPLTLLPYNGTDKPQVFLAVSCKVYDVTPGKGFYGPGGPYESFAGRDASRGLAKGSFDAEVLSDENGTIDTLEDLNEEEKVSLRGWEEHFGGKYAVVGELVENGEDGDEEEEGVSKA